jgi:hypothetical protein
VWNESCATAREQVRLWGGSASATARTANAKCGVKDSPRLPHLDLYIHGAVFPGTHTLRALTAGENLSR